MAKPSGTHEDYARDEDLQGSSDRSFGFVFTGFFALVGGVKLYTGHAWALYWFAGAATFLAAALLVPRILAPLNRLWMKFALLLYAVMNPLTMALLFFLVVTPIGVVMRLAGKDFLRKRLEPDAPSYWLPRDPPGPAPDSMKQQF
ncbi:MAG: SxtJ family membrane protein [Magnetospirillum sp.]|jgi:hypothetical protein|nr:SxtJ family membrane protein [Magnetospirillum sp.]